MLIINYGVHNIQQTASVLWSICRLLSYHFLYAPMKVKFSSPPLHHGSMGKPHDFLFGWRSVDMACAENNSLAKSHMVIETDSGSADLITCIFFWLILNDTEKSIMRTAPIILQVCLVQFYKFDLILPFSSYACFRKISANMRKHKLWRQCF